MGDIDLYMVGVVVDVLLDGLVDIVVLLVWEMLIEFIFKCILLYVLDVEVIYFFFIGWMFLIKVGGELVDWILVYVLGGDD